jgi:pimeloyl-ACP methyl ester carboxylesterase
MQSHSYLLIHGAWHDGSLMEPVAQFIRNTGHICHTLTLIGNRPEDDRSKVNLSQVISGVKEYIEAHNLQNLRLVGHSFGGMIISKLSELIPERIHRLIYWSAFVPKSGECVLDMMPDYVRQNFESQAKEHNNQLRLSFDSWRELFMNDASYELARSSFKQLNPQGFLTFSEPLHLENELIKQRIKKSYIYPTSDTAMPHSQPWHPRLSERLGTFRLLLCEGGHELCFTNPPLIAQKIVEAGKD